MVSAVAFDRDGDAEISLSLIAAVLWRYRFLILLVTALFGAVAVILALTATHIYRAQVLVTERTDQTLGGGSSLATQLGGLASLAGVNLGAGGSGKEAIALLKSSQLVDEFIKRNGLMETLLLQEEEGRATLWWASRFFKKDVLTIKEDTLSGTVTVIVEWTDPQVAAQWANGLVALANELSRTRTMEEAHRSIDFLKKQLPQTDVVEIKRAIYNLIEAETKTLMLTNARMEYSFKVIDPATAPELRSKPRRTLMVLVGCLLGLLCGSIIAFVHRSVKTRGQNLHVERQQ